MGGGKFHWNHGKPRIQRFLTQRARSTQRKAVFGVRTCEIIRKSRVAEDFWLGQGTKAAAIPAAVLSRLSNAGQAKKTRNPLGERRKGRLAVLLAQLQPAEGMLLRERLAIRPFLLSRGYFLIISQVLRAFPYLSPARKLIAFSRMLRATSSWPSPVESKRTSEASS